MLPETDFSARQRRLCKALPRRVQALLVSHSANIRYLCGFTGSSGVLVVSGDVSAFFADGRYTEQSKQEVRAEQVVIEKAPFLAAARWLREHKFKKVAYEGQHLSVAQFRELQKQAGKSLRLIDSGALVEELRMTKDAQEIASMRSAAQLGVQLYQKIKPQIRAGAKESEVAAELEYAARSAGAQAMSFETIVAGGARSALPHGRASDQPLPDRGFVVLDFGVILSGYCSDMTRTVHVGEPDLRARKLYSAVLKAQLAAIEAVRPGVSVGSVDRAARRVLEAEGFGQFFTHSTGHGVGLEIHEPPRVAKGQRQTLREGMIITIEPGAYVPREGGVRIEDMVLVTRDGCEVLTPASKELVTV